MGSFIFVNKHPSLQIMISSIYESVSFLDKGTNERKKVLVVFIDKKPISGTDNREII
jgi:NMD protein affecting ribosome stability and mRNA decay